ncbi:MAG: NADP-dependent oxidoreductase [Deltaproteobacteria bacterium]|nr:NADP-dependent oxidoreductase [Deltaproteobacteria bacterium]
MKAVRIHEFGGLDSLRVEAAPRPEPGAGEVLVRIHAAGINPVDWKTCAGEGVASRLDDPFPFIPGWDVSGVVEALGADIADFRVGDAVCGMVRWPWRGGGYAEYVAAPSAELVAKPDTMDDAQAAGLPLAALTAWQALFDIADVQAGQKVLIHAAAGGVGHIAIQLAMWKGAHVVGTASARNEAFLRELGVDDVIDYNATRFEEAVSGVDVVLDGVGGEVQERSWPVIRRGGVLASIRGRPRAEEAAARGVRAQHVSVHADAAQLLAIAALAAEGRLQVHVDAAFALDEVRKAHEVSKTGHARGKLVLRTG